MMKLTARVRRDLRVDEVLLGAKVTERPKGSCVVRWI
jgi:hypothetical protein